VFPAISRDVTELKRAERKLEQFLDLASEAIVAISEDGLIVLANAQAEKAFGYKREQMHGRPLEMLVPERYRGSHVGHRSRYFADLRTRSMGSGLALYGLRNDGTEFPAEISLSSIETEEGTLATAAIRDITERVSDHAMMQRLRVLVDSSDDAIIDKQLDGTIVSWNGGAERIYGYSANEVLGKSISILMPPERCDELASLLERIASGERVNHHETVRMCKDGRRIDVSVTVSPINDARGSVIGAVTIARDITERKRAEENVHAVLESSPDAIVIVSSDGRIERVNRQTEQLFGYRRDELRGQHVEVLLPERVRDAHAGHRGGYFAAPETRSMGAELELYARRGDGTEFPVEVSLSPLHTASGVLVSAAIRDVSERRRIRDELRRSNHDLEQFANVASHDLSEPLRVIAGFVDLLARRYRGQLDEDADKFIAFTVSGVERMQTLIDDLLAYSRIGRAQLNLLDVDTAAVARDVVRDLEATIADAGALVEMGELPTVRGEPTLLRQVFQNLIANAVKFTAGERPQVRISATRRSCEWRFEVQDNGPGIDPRHAQRIFEVFQRLHGREVPGTGVGLSITKRAVERHGGSIDVGPAPGGGSIFRFTIPQPREADHELPHPT
jgi:PAS domain S-box-containing protein